MGGEPYYGRPEGVALRRVQTEAKHETVSSYVAGLQTALLEQVQAVALDGGAPDVRETPGRRHSQAEDRRQRTDGDDELESVGPDDGFESPDRGVKDAYPAD